MAHHFQDCCSSQTIEKVYLEWKKIACAHDRGWQKAAALQNSTAKISKKSVTSGQISAKNTSKNEIRFKLFQEEQSQTKWLRQPKYQTFSCHHQCYKNGKPNKATPQGQRCSNVDTKCHIVDTCCQLFRFLNQNGTF